MPLAGLPLRRRLPEEGKPVTRHHFAARTILRYDRRNRLLRLARVVWQRGIAGDGTGYSSKLSLALRPAAFAWRREWDGWLLTVAGVRLHYQRSYGGIQV
jgi:hypothetical protein